MTRWIEVILLGFVVGTIGYLSGIPLGTLMATCLVIALIQVKYKRYPELSTHKKRTIQALIGGSIGLTVTSDTFSHLGPLLYIALIIPILQITVALMITFLFIKFLKVDPLIAFFCSVPAGISEVSIIADSYGMPLDSIITVHIFRILMIIIMIPMIVYFLI